MKTPEQMAREFANDDWGEQEWGAYCGFLAGYQAAKDQLADAGKVMPQWISVKDRLPEDGVGWCTVYGCILSRWSVQPGFYDRESKEWVSRFINGYMDDEGYAPFESVTHWMPLPSVEGLKHED